MADMETGTSGASAIFKAEHRAKLRDTIAARSFRTGQFTLASGKTSTLYFNLKPTMMTPVGAALGARALLAVALECDADYISGLEMGAVPAIGAMAALGEELGHPVATTFVRKSRKGHGTQQLVEGLGPDESLEGRNVLVIDDVATSGGSILQAIKEVRAAGGVVTHAACLVDRQEGGSELLAEHGVELHGIFTAADFTD